MIDLICIATAPPQWSSIKVATRMSVVDASSSTLFFTGSPDELASAQERRFLVVSFQWTSIGKAFVPSVP